MGKAGELTLHFGDQAAMGMYLLVVVAMGLWFSRDEKTSEDYLLGGRTIPWYAIGISYMMSLLSTYSMVMVPGEIFNNGLSLWMLGLLAPFTTILAFYVFIRFYFRLQSFTPFEYLERRYDKNVRLLVSVIYLWTRLLYLAMVLFATSKVFQGGAGWRPWATILLVGAIGIVYTVLGGMKAVVWTDVLQFFVLGGGLIVAIVFCVRATGGGFFGVITYALEHGRGPTRYAEASFYYFNPYVRLCFWLLLLGRFTEPLFYSSADQISVQRLLSTKSYEDAKKAIFANAVLSLPFMLALWYIGLAIFTYYSQHPDPNVTAGDTAFFTFVTTKLPTPLPGLIFAAMLAAAMSTLDSGMNSLSAVYVKELHIKYVKPSASESEQVVMSRLMTVAVGAFAVGMGIIIAETSETLRQSVVEAATIFGSLGVVILPAYLLAVTTERASGRLIWTLASLCWGISFGAVTWYSFSRTGLTGPIPSSAPVIPATLSAAIAAAGGWMKLARHRGATFVVAASLFPLGYGLCMAFWYLMARCTGGGQLSFQWVGIMGFMPFLVLGYGYALLFGKKQEPKKHVGLTLWSMREQVIAD